MNKFNVFVVLSIVAAASLFGAMVTPALAMNHVSTDNMTMPMDNSSMPIDQMGNMTMMMDNSTSMTGNSTTQ